MREKLAENKKFIMFVQLPRYKFVGNREEVQQ